MSFFSRLLGRFKTPDKSIVGKYSILALMIQSDTKFESKTCSICKNTALIPASSTQFVGQPEGGFTVDVGGYCEECKAHRCGVHTNLSVFPLSLWNSKHLGAEECLKRMSADLKEKEVMMVNVLGCRKCNTPYALRSKAAADYVRGLAGYIEFSKILTGQMSQGKQ